MESSPPAVQAVPQGPCGQGLRAALSCLPALPARGLAGGASYGQDLGRAGSGHICTHVAPGSPRASSRRGGWAPRTSRPPRTGLYGVLACGLDPAVSIRSTQPPSRGGN